MPLPESREYATKAELAELRHMFVAMVGALETRTNVSLKTNVDHSAERVANLKELWMVSSAATATAITKAEVATEHRFASVNEFRELVNDVIRGFMTRQEFDAIHRGLEDKNAAHFKANDDRITLLVEHNNKFDGKAAGASTTIAYIAMAISMIGGIAGIGAIALKLLGG